MFNEERKKVIFYVQRMDLYLTSPIIKIMVIKKGHHHPSFKVVIYFISLVFLVAFWFGIWLNEIVRNFWVLINKCMVYIDLTLVLIVHHLVAIGFFKYACAKFERIHSSLMNECHYYDSISFIAILQCHRRGIVGELLIYSIIILYLICLI